MKYHKLHKASFRQSVFFLFLMILGITLPIACSDLRGPQGLSPEEIEQETMTLSWADVSINGVKAIDSRVEGISRIKAPGFGALIVQPKDYGTFLVGLRKFNGAQIAGSVIDNKIQFSINELNVLIESEVNILNNNSISPVWVKHLNEQVYKQNALGTTVAPDTYSNEQKNTTPPSPPTSSVENDFFVVVEEMPKLKGGMKALQSKMEYPQLARRAGIEGRVTVEFIVNEQGNVENPKVVRGIGGGADAEALRVIKQAEFIPGKQRGRTVRVKYALSINFRLQDSDFSEYSEGTPPPPVNQMDVQITQSGNGTVSGIVTDLDGNPLMGANVQVQGMNIGAATKPNGEFTINNLPDGNQTLVISFLGFENASEKVEL